MKKTISLIFALVILLSSTQAVPASAETYQPGDIVEVSIPYSSAKPIVAMELDYTISQGLTFLGATHSGGMMGSASGSKAVYISLSGVSEGSFILRLSVDADAAGEESVTVTSFIGGSSGDSSTKTLALPEKHVFVIQASDEPMTVPAAPVAPAAPATADLMPSPTMMLPALTKGEDIAEAKPQATLQPDYEDEKVPEATVVTQGFDFEYNGVSFEAPIGFEVLKAAANNVPNEYTAIKFSGATHTVYAFTDKSGGTQFRVYGRLNSRKGMFETHVMSETSNEGNVLHVFVIGSTPIRDALSDYARAEPVAVTDSTLPEGFRRANSKAIIYFVNVFGQKEYRILGEITGVENAYYPSSNGRPRIGSLAIDTEGDRSHMAEANANFRKIPEEYRKGYATSVFIFTNDGRRTTVLTDRPILDIETLQ